MEETTQTASQGVYAWGTGRRKTSVARVRILEGSGKVSINDRTLEEFFSREKDRAEVLAPLKATDTLKKYDVIVDVEGGGSTGQSGAVSLGIARALQKVKGEHVEKLREYGLLTRDSRMKERKKYGQKGARKRFQWTKR
ncbi:MAG TPA: 30S ribosomal protein S9 [Candidatus Hypogeohydataceae bacterium YC38]|jgi:small subunit ribosomal protein S9|nr:30S ribosomal protein S9 [Candidatus Brocadiales bacterium]